MKKLFVIFAVFAALIFVTSCGGGSSNNSGDNNQDDNQSSEVCEYGEYECHGDNSYVCDYSDDDELMWMSFETCSNGCDSTTGKCKGGSIDTTPAPTEEGIYLGIIGFNNTYYPKDIERLTSGNMREFHDFIDDLKQLNLTTLYYADDKALEMMRNYPRPNKLQKVALITFTDGLDNQSTADEFKPEYGKSSDYRDDLHEMIVNEKIHGKKVEAFAIGLQGEDIPDELVPEFDKTLQQLASSDKNAFHVSDMDEVEEHFAEIADSLYKVTTSINMGIYIPGGYDDGQVIRYTFDYAESAESSNLYIQATYHKKDGKKTLEKITYQGFAKGAETITSTSKGPSGELYFQFDDLKYSDGSTVSEDVIKYGSRLWKQLDTGGWYGDIEIDMAELPPVVDEEKSSALIMLVLDCTTSLGSDFENMQQAAKTFINTLVNGVSATSGDSTTVAGCSKDSASGFTWSKKTASTMNWSDALSYCENLTECGHSDWTLPNIDKLRTLLIADRVSNNCSVSEANSCLSYGSCWSCSTCTQAGTTASNGKDCASWGGSYSDGRYSKFGDSEYFWSASSLSDGSGSSWNVDFGNASIYDATKSNGGYVRCVR